MPVPIRATSTKPRISLLSVIAPTNSPTQVTDEVTQLPISVSMVEME